MRTNDLSGTIAETIQDKPKGGEQYVRTIDRALQKGILDLFVPWAAPPNGRSMAGSEQRSIEWLLGENGLIQKIGGVVKTRLIVMPADSYVKRNGFDMEAANSYWDEVALSLSEKKKKDFFWLPSSEIEELPSYSQYCAEEAYALEAIEPKTRVKILEAAEKYASNSADAYEAAGEYAMRRAAEARVVKDMGAIWVSLNWPERDIMCGDTPRVYVPERVRTPWLKEA